MGLVVGAIAPHGALAVAEACDASSGGLAAATQVAMDEMGRRIAAAGPDTVVLATPHGLHVRGNIAVVTSASLSGTLEDSAVPLSLTCTVDRELALACSAALTDAGISAVEVSYGGNHPAEADVPLDWGSLIPLWHVQRHAPRLPVVILAPARELSGGDHVRAGAVVAAAARGLSRRIAFIASADQGHGHAASGRYGYHPESAVFDQRVVDIVRRGTLEELTDIGVDNVHAALADSWWQMLMLVGALRNAGAPHRCELLAYEAPTYYGMLTAVIDVDTAGGA